MVDLFYCCVARFSFKLALFLCEGMHFFLSLFGGFLLLNLLLCVLKKLVARLLFRFSGNHDLAQLMLVTVSLSYLEVESGIRD